MTETSRRAVLRAGALAAAAVPLVGTLVAPDAATAAGADARASGARRLYARSRFSPLVGASFTVVEPSRAWRMRLTEVGDLSPASAGAEGAFALTFSSATPGPTQGTFLVRRPGFPATTLFLVPSDVGRRTFQAVVNSV